MTRKRLKDKVKKKTEKREALDTRGSGKVGGRSKIFKGATLAVKGIADDASRVKKGVFNTKSSLGVSFVAISNRRFLAEGPAETPTAEEWAELLAFGTGTVNLWEKKGAVVLADFEGEFTGMEGELVSAVFQRTLSLEPSALRPIPASGPCRDTGLLVDMRCAEGVALVKQVMESDAITKVIWGADGDVTSLRYTPTSSPHAIHSARVADAQLAYSHPGRRLGMAKALEKLPATISASLPAKAAMDFETPHSSNSRALPLPLSKLAASYAVDDVHRLDILLRNLVPREGGYVQCMDRTGVFIAGLVKSPTASSLEKLRQYQGMMEQKKGVQRQAYAVRAKRHILAFRISVPDFHESGLKETVDKFAEIEADADKILSEAGVVIPKDLSFSERPEVVPSALSEGSPKVGEQPAEETGAGPANPSVEDVVKTSSGVGPKGIVKAVGAKPKAGANSFLALLGSEDEPDTEEDAPQPQAAAQGEPKEAAQGEPKDEQQAESKKDEPKAESKKSLKKKRIKEAREKKANKKPKTGALDETTAGAGNLSKADSTSKNNDTTTKVVCPEPTC